MFTVYRVTRESEYWKKACVYYIRLDEFVREYDVGVAGEMDAMDTPETEYILVMDEKGNPASTCRLHYLDEKTGKIERVSTLKELRGTGAGSVAIRAAEEWLKENGIVTVMINSRDTAIGFYEKLGYQTDWSSHRTLGPDEKSPFHTPDGNPNWRTPHFGTVNTYKTLQ